MGATPGGKHTIKSLIQSAEVSAKRPKPVTRKKELTSSDVSPFSVKKIKKTATVFVSP